MQIRIWGFFSKVLETLEASNPYLHSLTYNHCYPKMNQPWMIIIIPAKIKETDKIVPWEFSKRVSFHIALILIKVRCRPNKCQFTWLSSFFNWRNSIPAKISPVAIGWVHVKLLELIYKRWGLQNVKIRL